MKTPVIKIPVKILVNKIAQNKQNSVFYAGMNIAEVKIMDRLYVLTTSGHYSFSLAENRPTIYFDSDDTPATKRAKLRALPHLDDAKIKVIGDNDLALNWGWFGINVWKGDICLPEPVEVFSDYDEALKGFITYIQKDIA